MIQEIMRQWWPAILAVAILLAALVHGGLYDVRASGGGIYRVNKFTGGVTYCVHGTCKRAD